MFRQATRILAVFALVQAGCSGSSKGEPSPTDTSRDPAESAGDDTGTTRPPENMPRDKDPRPVFVPTEAGRPVAGDDRDAGELSATDASADGGSGYDPASDDPWGVERDAVPADPNGCLNASFVEPGHYEGDVGSHTNDYANPDKCGHGLPSEGRDAWVKVKVPAAQTISVWANVKETSDFDAVLYLLAGSCGQLGTCVAGANDHLASREHATWTNDTGAEVTVYVVFDLLLPPEELVETIPYYFDISVR